MEWDPAQYSRFADERSRPFHELLARVEATSRWPGAPSYVVDLGCGPGELTRTLADRWPAAQVVGVDSSPDMIAAAATHALPDRLTFVQADLATWQADRPVDLLVANAALQWVPGHVELIPVFAAMLSETGMLAFQVPDNFAAPSHVLLRDLRLSPRWRDVLAADADPSLLIEPNLSIERSAAVERPVRYLEAVVAAGLEADVWQTDYLHVLSGDDAVLEWVKGTALRPVLARLGDPAERTAFLDELGGLLRDAYPAGPAGTVFPFRRTFVVGRRAG